MKLPKIKWRKPPEFRVLDLIEKHLSLCVSTSDELLNAVEAKVAEEREKFEAHAKNVSRFEEEADNVRREIFETLAGGILPPLSKGDLINLVERLDMIADWSKESGRILEILPLEEFSKDLKYLFMEFTKMTNHCAHALSNVVRLLYTDYKKALDECNRVELFETEIDTLYMETLKALFDSKLKAQTLFLANELAKSLEMTGDSCEDTADLIRVVIVSTFY